ncbi:hypothetical protein L596_027595 [Steinernema carpocapsae]|uniref:HTH psq-type domain-containing protein n=1 Tax=Steinernema carpocapsae TaxID=34508 RepID=A0A4U5LVZ5_STECR|nr:hypothetical protein L596_027595 [Steinernema carpocapsae]
MCENKRTLRGFQPAAFDPSFDSFASSFPISSRSLLVSSQRSSCLLSAKPESGNSKIVEGQVTVIRSSRQTSEGDGDAALAPSRFGPSRLPKRRLSPLAPLAIVQSQSSPVRVASQEAVGDHGGALWITVLERTQIELSGDAALEPEHASGGRPSWDPGESGKPKNGSAEIRQGNYKEKEDREPWECFGNGLDCAGKGAKKTMESVKPYLSSHKVPLFYILHAPLTSGLFSLISELPGLETVFQRFSKDSDSSDAAEARVSPDYARDWKQSEVCEVCKCRRTSAGPATEEVTEKPQKSSFNISDLTKSKNSFTASSPPSKLDFDPFNPFLKGFGAPSAANAFPANAWTPTMFGMIPNPMIQSLHSYFGLEYHPPAFPLPFPPQWPSQSTLNGMLAAAISDKKKQQQEKAMKNSEAAKAKEVLKMETNGNAMEDQPLDLSAKTGIKIVVEDMSSDSPSESPPIASKSEPKQENVLVPPKMPLMVGTKRNYSQMDLEKAVLDIRSGRLGTRRASVVYGIPRSTLRNKIYKLEAAAELSGEPSQYKRRRAGGQTLQERLTAGESIREARKAQKAISTPENTWPTGVPPQPVETLQNGTASPEKSTFVEDLKPKAAAVAAAAGGRSGKRGEGVEQRRGFRGRRKVRRFQEDPSKTRTLQNPKIEQFMLLNVLVSNKRKASDSSLCLH